MWKIAVHLAVSGDVYDGLFVLSLFPRDVLAEILDLIQSVSEGFPTYTLRESTCLCTGISKQNNINKNINQKPLKTRNGTHPNNKN